MNIAQSSDNFTLVSALNDDISVNYQSTISQLSTNHRNYSFLTIQDLPEHLVYSRGQGLSNAQLLVDIRCS